MKSCTIQIKKGVARIPEVRLAEPVDLELLDGEHVAIMGPNASGKSLLVDMLTGKIALQPTGSITYDFRPSPMPEVYKNIKYITFRDTYGSTETNYYYQMRWNTTDHEEVPVVRELLGDYEESPLQRQLFDLFHIEPVLDKPIITLSSGEMRKFQLTKILLTHPRIVIMDNPFIGLDAETRVQLNDLLTQLSHMEGLQIILVLSMLDFVPDFITHVLPMEDKKLLPKITREEYLLQFAKEDIIHREKEETAYNQIQHQIVGLPYQDECAVAMPNAEIVRLNKVSIRYEERTILKELDWTVRRGEKWALSGANGSGKSTLLSLVCADNPQSYACDISLFGRKRGTGESIWDIKKHIGYVSPEMHRSYLKNLPAVEIVASGLHDTIGLYVKPRPEQFAICQWWMEIFGVGHLTDRPFLRLSSGEQRLVLLARAFVKDPELLILDEPLHGLDTYNRRRVKRVIEAFCRRKDKTMIMVTHYAEELPSTITHHLVLKKI
ncbi:MAG: ATP-binding cassette domain-containing protein [Bacteroidaceae bacterium]|nr:ATP-binding cassette domain-containing protein [Bacteroidaceae bacterium]